MQTTVVFSLTHVGGKQEQTSSNAARMVIGSGAHCDVKLPTDQAAFEHVIIELVNNEFIARSTGASPHATLNGVVLQRSVLHSNSVLEISGNRVQVEIRQSTDNSEASGRTLGGWLKVGALGGIVVAFAALMQRPAPNDFDSPPPPPELFASRAAACPRTDPREALAVGEDLRAIADGARERSPFAAREARRAIENYETAAACYRTAQHADEAAELLRSASKLREDVVADFRSRRVRLERLLRYQDDALAIRDIEVLEALTEGTSSPYTIWLSRTAKIVKSRSPKSSE